MTYRACEAHLCAAFGRYARCGQRRRETVRNAGTFVRVGRDKGARAVTVFVFARWVCMADRCGHGKRHSNEYRGGPSPMIVHVEISPICCRQSLARRTARELLATCAAFSLQYRLAGEVTRQ